MSVCHVHVWCPWKSEEVPSVLGTSCSSVRAVSALNSEPSLVHVVIILSQGSYSLGLPQVHCVAEYDLEFQNFCSLLLKFWEHRHAPQNLADNR